MNLTKVALTNNRVTIMVMLLVFLIGYTTYLGLPRDSMPPFTIRVASVVTQFPGASPERVELLISDKIEKVAQEIPQVKYISSTSRTGLSVVSIAVRDDVPKSELQPIWDRLRRKIEGIQNQLPNGIIGPIVKDDDLGNVYGIFVGFTFDGFTYKERKVHLEALRDKVIALPNAAKAEIGGIIDERIYIDFNDGELAKLGINASQIQNIIASTNIINPAGEVNLGDKRISLEPSGSIVTISELEKLLVPVGTSGNTVPLGEITTIRQDYVKPRSSIVKINGDEAMVLYISLKENANIIQLGKEVDELLTSFNAELPVGISAHRISSQDHEVEKSVNNFINNVIQSVVIVLLVILIFLGFRAGMIIASIIPAAILATFMMMGLFDVGLNSVTLAGLIMALGLLVDNGIVVTETIIEQTNKGKSVFQAGVAACKEFFIPLLISSLTTSAAFLSFYLAESVMGEIMGKLFLIISFSLLSSWIFAFTLIPLLAYFFLKSKAKDGKPHQTIFEKFVPHYRKALAFTLKKPWLTVSTVLIIFVLSLFGFTSLPFIFSPDSDRNLVTLDLNLPLGTKLETTENNIQQIERFIQDSLLVEQPFTDNSSGVTDWSSYIGVGPNAYDLGYSSGEQNSGYAHMLINTSSAEANQDIIDRLDHFCFNNLIDARVTIKRLGSGGGASIPVSVRISGGNSDELMKIASSIKQQLFKIDGSKNIEDSWGPKMKKFFIDIDEARLRQSGLTHQDIANSLSTNLTGKTISEFREANNTIPIVLKVEGNESLSFSDLETMTLFAQNSGKNIPLTQVAEIVPKWQYSKILRRDLKKTVSVNCQLEPGYTAGDITNQLTPWLEEQAKSWPTGYHFALGGESESSGEAMGAVMNKLGISMFIMVLLLVIQFNSMRKTFIILATIPLGIIGIVGGLHLANSFFSFTAFLGIISLAGIIINDGIVLLDKINSDQNSGLSIREALLKASGERFSPILLTTFTTSFVMVPLWIDGGAMWKPMAISIIFGLLFGTIILLIFVPSLYAILFKNK